MSRLVNLIGNALKYRGVEAPRIRIEAVRQKEYWQLSVRDNGQGFEAEFASQIFDPFKRQCRKQAVGTWSGRVRRE